MQHSVTYLIASDCTMQPLPCGQHARRVAAQATVVWVLLDGSSASCTCHAASLCIMSCYAQP